MTRGSLHVAGVFILLPVKWTGGGCSAGVVAWFYPDGGCSRSRRLAGLTSAIKHSGSSAERLAGVEVKLEYWARHSTTVAVASAR